MELLWRVGEGAGTQLLFEGWWLHCALSCKAVSFVPINVYKQTGGGKESISLFAVYTKSCFFFALLHGIYGLNLSIVICIVTEPAVLTYYIH